MSNMDKPSDKYLNQKQRHIDTYRGKVGKITSVTDHKIRGFFVDAMIGDQSFFVPNPLFVNLLIHAKAADLEVQVEYGEDEGPNANNGGNRRLLAVEIL